MVLKSLREAAVLIRKEPLLWLPGMVLGLTGAAGLLLQAGGDSFLTERLLLLELVIIPFLLGGFYGVIKEECFTHVTSDDSVTPSLPGVTHVTSDDSVTARMPVTLGTFVRQGTAYYFRLLLPMLVIFFAALFTVFALAVPLMVVGISPESGIIVLLAGVLVPFIFFTYFYDTAVIFEDEKVFTSIRRSIGFVMNNRVSTLLFYVVNLAIVAAVGLALMFVWAGLVGGDLEPLLSMGAAEVDALMPADLLAMLGTGAVMVTAAIYALFVVVTFTLLHAYKVCFFRRYAGGAGVAGEAGVTPLIPGDIQGDIQGEYDEKGRWYKY